ncbi:MAG: transcriptional regulator [Candidatus Poribacteria bacterium]|nr:transcriptional regulator [Candidatus Poribacteria bacterium]
MRKLRTWREYLIKRLASDPERASGYLQAALEESQIHGDPAVFLLALQTVIESQGGISTLAKQIETDPQILLEILNSNELPRVEMLTAILNALGCQISIQSVEAAKSGVEIAPTESAHLDFEVAAEN